MQVAILSDIHIGFEEETKGFDVRGQFLRILDDLVEQGVQEVVLCGDLCFNRSKLEIIDWVDAQFTERNINYLPIPGNHDSTEHFLIKYGFLTEDSSKKTFYYCREWANYLVLFIDSSKGNLDEHTWSWLEEKVLNSTKSILLFMHHPPIAMDVPFMDTNHGFRESERMKKIFSSTNQFIQVVCGHYHQVKHRVHPDYQVFIAPSTYTLLHFFKEGPKTQEKTSVYGYALMEMTDVQSPSFELKLFK